MGTKTLPIGIDSFEKLRTKDCYYVDKTLLLKKLIDNMAEVTLFTRPRRFGKSLNLSMLQCYFEKKDKNQKQLFEGLNIANAGDKYTEHMGKYPVIMLNFKEAKQATFEDSYEVLIYNIGREFKKHEDKIKQMGLNVSELSLYQSYQNQTATKAAYLNSVQFLCTCLEKAYGEKVILLLDEYDVPLENAYFRGFYETMLDFERGILSVALKTNSSLSMAVLTGCLRISKESIFTGLNNLKIVSIENKMYGEYFGFTENEVDQMLTYYDKKQCEASIKNWYNGYLFGNSSVYNPWSLINYMDALLVDDQERPKPYWSNTSANSIVKDLVERIDTQGKVELETLMSGGTIEKPIHEDITYADIDSSMDNLWDFLYFTGYLKKVSERFEIDTTYVTLQIPNVEVNYIYRRQIREWMRVKLENTNLLTLQEATLVGDSGTMEAELKRVLLESISYYDTNSNNGDGEAFYHGIMLGLYRGMKDYVVISNRESGNGRPDLILKYLTFEGKAYIFEFKLAKQYTELEKVTQDALEQIEEQKYKAGLLAEGYTDITVYGIGFYKKSCMVKSKHE